MAKVKVTLTMEESFLERIREYASNNGVSVSAAVSILTSQRMDEMDAMKEMPALRKLYEEALPLLDK